MEITGKLIVKGDLQKVSDKFQKRTFVLLDESTKYPQPIELQLTQDKCNILDAHEVGSELTAEFNLRGREWSSPKGEVKYFNTLEAYKLNNAGVSKKALSPKNSDFINASNIMQDDSGLPF